MMTKRAKTDMLNSVYDWLDLNREKEPDRKVLARELAAHFPLATFDWAWSADAVAEALIIQYDEIQEEFDKLMDRGDPADDRVPDIGKFG